jgi:hypothetical protein
MGTELTGRCTANNNKTNLELRVAQKVHLAGRTLLAGVEQHQVRHVLLRMASQQQVSTNRTNTAGNRARGAPARRAARITRIAE